MAVAAEKRTYTVDDLWELSHRTGKRYELVKGELRELAPAGEEHGYVELNLAAALREFVQKHLLGKVVSGEVGFVLADEADSTVRGVEVAFIHREKLPDGSLPSRFARFAPDLVAEVLSPSDGYSEVMEKVNDWLQAGVRVVWVVHPQGRRVIVCRPQQVRRSLDERDVLSSEDVLPGFECKVSEIFA